MATVSTSSTTATTTTLNSPDSPRGNDYSWDSSLRQVDDSSYTRNEAVSFGLANNLATHDAHENGSAGGESIQRYRATASNAHSPPESDSAPNCQNDEANNMDDAPQITQNGSADNSTKRNNTTGPFGGDPDDANSKWIHRDKLARIESEELQAAGIILPKLRARSKPRRDISVDRANGYRKGGMETNVQFEPRSARSSNFEHPPWDLRLPEEIAADAYFALPGSTKSGSRIPVAKQSLAPVPTEHIERETMRPRKRDNSPGTEENIAYTASRSRSNSVKTGDKSATSLQRNPARSTSDVSPKKLASGSTTAGRGRKSSTASKANSNGHPKTRSGSNRDMHNGTRHTARSGERELTSGTSNKCPEGEPPWMVSAYRPDPRLPPDQQLLPTVAKRLQQEKWEREGKFGSVYDKEFRPLTDQGFPTPPEPAEKEPSTEAVLAIAENHQEWPLKPEGRGPIFPIGRTGSYSTIPKIQEKPSANPLPSSQVPEAGVIRTPSMPQEEDTSKGGCGCCIIM